LEYCYRKGEFVQQALNCGEISTQPNQRDEMRSNWQNLLRTWAVDTALADQSFEEVREHYAEPGRFYHTIDHIQSVLKTVESLGSHARNLNVVKLAAWLHDVIYDSRASDNEERSAAYAERLCEKLSIPENRQVASLILKTKTHDAGDDPDAQVLLDADLAILGASERVYQDYAEKIRQEYAWVPEPDYRVGRRQILSQFLTGPRLFHFLLRLEEPARHNMAAEIARLGAS
jgi:predicted metal-dependent HD superfamily phosphohydrolase